LNDLPESTAKKLPRYPLVPAILLGRLAVGQTHRGKGYGELLLIDALKRCLDIEDIGWAVILVNAKDEVAAAFYEHYDFIRLTQGSSRLFLPRSTIVSLIG
jgi:GNAT superfamily N-acetyltransferase